MKTIYLCDEPKYVRDIYLTSDKIYSKADILSNAEAFEDVEFVFSTWGMPQFSEDEIKEYLPSLKAVFYAAGSVQYFARPFLSCGIKVFSAWAANAIPVAEYTVAQIVLANKGFFKTMRFKNKDDARKIFEKHPGNFGVKIGIIGAGTIGKLVIKMLKNYNLDLLVFDPFLSEEQATNFGVKKTSLEEIFAQCQVVSNHLADNEQTRGMLCKKHFEAMLPYSTFLNTGRGAQVVESDLISVLKARDDITAILDVTHPEPPEQGSELYTLQNCILTPHIAGSWGNEVRRMGEFMKAQYENLINNRPCEYEVTLKMLETMA